MNFIPDPMAANCDPSDFSSTFHNDYAAGRLESGSDSSQSMPQGLGGFSLDIDQASEMAAVRLGMASGLFETLRMKHTPTALHSLRVALGCSVWFDHLGPAFDKNDLEIAALLHDLGKIGVPDEILAKPSVLNEDEKAIVDRQRRNGFNVLRTFCKSQNVIDFVEYSAEWFDGSRTTGIRKVEDIPVGAQMLAIVDAFDSMTCEQVYRKALSIEQAVAELFEYSGTQFDPELVLSFAELVSQDWFDMQLNCCKRWSEKSGKSESVLWSVASNLSTKPVNDPPVSPLQKFHESLTEQMLDGVIFVDRQGTILYWSPAIERITGIQRASVLDRRFCPSLIDLQDESATLEIPDSDCPVQSAMSQNEVAFGRFSLKGRGAERHIVEIQVSPVVGVSGESIGATILLHDSSNICSLEERVESLYSRASQDPLTKVANRAEFDRVHVEFVDEHLTANTPCSLIICDLDFFKKINDDFGHQAGDQALISFASLLKRFHRVGDLVARYGGEEFVLLCAGCDNKTATERAEEIRHALQSTPLEVLDNKCLTASFGVTEVQKGDSPELMLRRADRALIMAKENGRNRVVQLGAGMDVDAVPKTEKKSGGFFDWFKKKAIVREEPIQQCSLVSQVPLELAVQKLRGFVVDQDSQIIEVEGNDISIKVSGHNPDFGQRSSDRPVPFHVLLQFSTIEVEINHRRSTKTRINVLVSPIRTRDRRKTDLAQRANLIIKSLQSYLMASSEEGARENASHLERAATESGRD